MKHNWMIHDVTGSVWCCTVWYLEGWDEQKIYVMVNIFPVPDGHSGSLHHCHVPLRSHMAAKDVSRWAFSQNNVYMALSIYLFWSRKMSRCAVCLLLLHKFEVNVKLRTLIHVQCSCCCHLGRYIAQHMNIHNPEDFALFRITERKGMYKTRLLYRMPKINSSFFRLHVSWRHVSIQNTGL